MSTSEHTGTHRIATLGIRLQRLHQPRRSLRTRPHRSHWIRSKDAEHLSPEYLEQMPEEHRDRILFSKW